MQINTYNEWKQAVLAEFLKLSEVSYYLNEKGKERLRVFDTLSCLMDYCESAEELIEWIDSREGLDKSDVESIESPHAMQAIAKLRKVAGQADWADC